MKDSRKQKKKSKEESKYQQFTPFLPLVLFFVVLISLFVLNTSIQRQIERRGTLANPVSSFSSSFYPILKEPISPLLSAQAALILDDESSVVLFAKNDSLRFSMASTVKIMTALVALDYYKTDDVLTVLDNNILGVKVGFGKGEKIRFEDLLYAMLLPSGNDAALTIAQNYPGGMEAFVKAMNKKAKDLHLFSTHFSDSAGLKDDGDYTTVIDLARLASTAVKNKTFAEIVSTKYKVISSIDGSRSYELRNLNRLLGINGVDGIKTGFTDEAGGVLVTSAIQDGHLLIITVMKSQDRFLDTEALLSSLKGNLTFLSIRP
ncbi:MAG: hypothetical protein Q8Q96_01180 [bacterium]|nr:hypothetical protein [bacterium]